MDSVKGLNFGLGSGVKVTVSTNAAKSAALAVGERYAVTASTPCHIRLGADGETASVNDFLLGTGQWIELEPWSTNLYLHCICPSGSSGGSVHLSKRRSF